MEYSLNYHAVGSRCAVHIPSLKLPIEEERTKEILRTIGFQSINVNLVQVARSCIGRSAYRRGALPSEAPAIIDCSSFMQWIYGQRGIEIPRYSIDQRGSDYFASLQSLSQIIPGDLVFVSGFHDYFWDNPSDGVGHVGLATREGTVIHAPNRKLGIIETAWEKFMEKGFRGVKRIIPLGYEVLTLEVPKGREVKHSQEVRWIVLQNI